MAGKIDFTYSSGWLRGREAAIDASSGEELVGPGVHVRLRLSDISGYMAAEEGTTVFMMRGEPEPVILIGSVHTVDKIMERAALHTIPEKGSD